MRAVLADGIRCMAGVVGTKADRTDVAAQARRWVAEKDPTWPYSFENVCLGLDLEPGRVRTQLLGSAATLRTVLERLEQHLLAP